MWMVCCACRTPLLLPAVYPLSNSVNNLVEYCSDGRWPNGLHKDRGKTKALEPIERRREGGGLTCYSRVVVGLLSYDT